MTPLGDIERPGGGRCRVGGLIAFSQAKTNDQYQEKRMSSATPPGPASRDRRIVAWPLAAAATALAFLLALSPSAAAAIALVKNLGTNGNTTSGKTLAINPSSTVAVGDTVIVTFAMDPDSGTVSCADSKGNT